MTQIHRDEPAPWEPDTPDEGDASAAVTAGLTEAERDAWMHRWFARSRWETDSWGRRVVILRFRCPDGKERPTSGRDLDEAILTAMQVQRSAAGMCYGGEARVG